VSPALWRIAVALAPRWPWGAHQRAEQTIASGLDASVVPGVVLGVESDGRLLVWADGVGGLQRWHPGRWEAPWKVPHTTVPDLLHPLTLIAGVAGLLPGRDLSVELSTEGATPTLLRWALRQGPRLAGRGIGADELAVWLRDALAAAPTGGTP